jgi:hypothetical protein
MLYKKTDQRYR